MKDLLGDRQKIYEGMEADRRLMPQLPVMARIDGRSFSNFTRKMTRPYDQRMSDLMIATTAWLVEETNSCMGYSQSDEITLSWFSDDPKSQIFFDGRIMKMTSQLAAMASVYFNDQFKKYFTDFDRPFLATFDCRVWNVPSLEEGANCFLWREWDATKNAISMAARHYYSHNELNNKNGKEMQELLFQKGVNFNDYPSFFKRGTFIQRKKVVRKFTTEELDKLPEKHDARTNPELTVERSEYRMLNMPPFSKVTNRAAVIYLGEEPKRELEVT
jgi:tRNA(His) guanylyltransferase